MTQSTSNLTTEEKAVLNGQAQPKGKRSNATADRNRGEIKDKSSSAVATTQTRQVEKLGNLKAHIDRVIGERTFTVEAMSDLLSDLHDPKLLEQEIMIRTSEKLQERQETEDINWDSFDAYSSFELPALPAERLLFGSNAIGSLPASAKLSS